MRNSLELQRWRRQAQPANRRGLLLQCELSDKIRTWPPMLTTIDLASFDRSHHYHRKLIKCPRRQRLLPGVRVMQTIFEIKCCLVHDTRLSEQPGSRMLGPAESHDHRYHMHDATRARQNVNKTRTSHTANHTWTSTGRQAHVLRIVCHNPLTVNGSTNKHTQTL
jgi:hypothetical protein